MFNIIILNKKDNVGVAPMQIPANVNIKSDLKSINIIPFGHKISLVNIKKKR